MATSTSALNSKNLWRPSVLWLTFGGAGLLRPAPGTWGSLAALAVWWCGLSDLPVFVQVAVALTYALMSWWVESFLILCLGIFLIVTVLVSRYVVSFLLLVFGIFCHAAVIPWSAELRAPTVSVPHSA